MFKDKNILLGVTGGIAAYKAIQLTSKLTQMGAHVKVILTNGAQEFVTPLSFQAISRQPVYLDTFDELDVKEIQHVQLGDWADYIIVAPATANIIAKYRHGICDDLLSTTLLAATAPVYMAPAMNVHMLNHPATYENIKVLTERGTKIIEPNEGYLACGYVANGRMSEPEEIIDFISEQVSKNEKFKGKRFLITAGPTEEKIDPVRVLTNHSSGKMGYRLAKVAAEMGAKVTLVSGPVEEVTPFGVEKISVTTAEEMYQAVLDQYAQVDVVIKTAAVSDYTPVQVHDHKMKKQPGMLTLELKRTKDILKELGKTKKHQYLVGFAAETQDLTRYGKQKLADKQLDMIVVNDVSKPNQGFKSETNQVTIFTPNREAESLEMMTKEQLAHYLLDKIAKEVQ